MPFSGDVAPPAGAWIETFYDRPLAKIIIVAPPAGAWIETVDGDAAAANAYGRSPRGSVD